MGPGPSPGSLVPGSQGFPWAPGPYWSPGSLVLRGGPQGLVMGAPQGPRSRYLIGPLGSLVPMGPIWALVPPRVPGSPQGNPGHPRVPQGRSPPRPWIAGSPHEPTCPRAHRLTGPRAHGPTGPRAHGPTGPRAHGPTGPRAHGPTGPGTFFFLILYFFVFDPLLFLF